MKAIIIEGTQNTGKTTVINDICGELIKQKYEIKEISLITKIYDIPLYVAHNVLYNRHLDFNCVLTKGEVDIFIYSSSDTKSIIHQMKKHYNSSINKYTIDYIIVSSRSGENRNLNKLTIDIIKEITQDITIIDFNSFCTSKFFDINKVMPKLIELGL